VPRIELRDLYKRFGETLALAGADFELERGEVHALLGENGAGKSTLMRVLYGLVRPDRGEVRLDGRPIEVRGPRHALELGIGLVHQHFMGIPSLTVAENLALGEPGSLLLPRRELLAHARELLERFSLDLAPDVPAADLAVGEQQRLEIARALARGVEVLVLDEPTAVLAPSEVEALLELLGRLRASGHSIVFISHKLEEITAVCDRVTVLRHGRSAATLPVEGLRREELGRLMVGDAPPPPGQPPELARGPVALRLRSVCAPGLEALDLDVAGGEIVAVAGIDGNGQGALEAVLARVRVPTSGKVEILRPPLSLLAGDRQRHGLVLDLSLEENLILAAAATGEASPVLKRGWLRRRALRGAAQRAIERLEMRAEPEDRVRNLSGGNQQKLLVARALRSEAGLLVAVNPTRGLDVAATLAVRELLRGAARRGAGLLLISTDLDEVLELGTRVLVMFRGRLVPVEPERRTRERIGALMLGGSAA
jgi:simple sugar transport system ATP-binding protein